MSDPTDYEGSVLYVRNWVATLASNGMLADYQAKLPPELAEIVRNPWKRRWYGSAQIEGLIAAVGEPALIERLSYEMTAKNFGPIITPMLTVALTLVGASPATVFANMDSPLGLALRNAHCRWASKGPTSGTLIVQFPRAPFQFAEAIWRGVARFIFELAKKPQGKVDRVHRPVPNEVHLEASW